MAYRRYRHAPFIMGLVFLIGVTTPWRVSAQTSAAPSTATQSSAAPDQAEADQAPEWLFPIAKLDQALPRWLRVGGEYRNRFEGPKGIDYGGTSDSYLLGRLRAHATIQPTPWLRFQGEVQDARILFNSEIPNANPYRDTWTLWEGYVQAGSPTTGWIDALAGRQALAFGDERIIGPSNWLNVGRTFNVARVDLHRSDDKVSVFAASVVPGDGSELHGPVPGNNIYGVYGSLQRIIPKAAFEPYVLWRVAPSNSALPETLGRGDLNEVTIGLRVKGTAPHRVDYDSEFDGQVGSLGASAIGAWAGFAAVARQFPSIATSPRVFIEGNYASGTENPAGGHWNTFDQLYPSNHDKFGFTDQVGRRNLEQFRAGVEEEPNRKCKLRQAFDGYWLATSHDNFYGSSGAIAVAAHPGASRHIGNELDFVAEYLLSEGLNLGFGYARLFAGRFLETATVGKDYSYAYAYVEYNFSKSGFHFPITPNTPPQ